MFAYRKFVHLFITKCDPGLLFPKQTTNYEVSNTQPLKWHLPFEKEKNQNNPSYFFCEWHLEKELKTEDLFKCENIIQFN